MLPTLKKEPPTGFGWTHEVKFDGFRIQIHKDGTDVALYSRNGHDFTSRYPGLARAFSKRCSTRACILDAELTAIDSEGHPDFGALIILASTATSAFGSSTSSRCAGKTCDPFPSSRVATNSTGS